MFTALGFFTVIGITFAWLKVRHKRKAQGAGN